MSRTALELFKGSKLRTSIFALIVAIALLATGIACVTPTTPAQPDEAVLIPDPPIADEPLVTVLPPPGGIPTPECDAQEMFILNGQSVCPGDASNGQQVFIGATGATACSSCHTTDLTTLVGPGMQDIFARSAERIVGLSASDYIYQSLRDPASYIVEDFTNVMPVFDDSLIGPGELLDLIAYLQGL